MSNELQVAEAYNIVVTAEQKELVKKTVFPDATDAELQLFFFDCTRRGIHPLDKLIHPTKRNGKYTSITSIDLFRQRASESGEHMGTDDAVYTGDPGQKDFACSVTVYKHLRGEKCPFTATARWSEYFPGEKQGFMWQKMPHLMLAKCAEALALRKAFPQQLHGLYTNEEMAQAGPAPEPTRSSIPQVRPQVGNRDMSPVIDKYTGEPRQEDGAGHEGEPTIAEAPLPPHRSHQQASDAPAPLAEPVKAVVSGAERARQIAEGMTDQYDEGLISNFVKYQGQKAYQKGCSPGYFDLEDGQGGLVRKFKYLDPDLDVTSGLKRVYYRTENFKGKTSYAVTKIEAIE